MQDDKSTNQDTEKIVNKPSFWVWVLLLVAVIFIIYIIPWLLVNDVMSKYDNSTMAQMHVDIADNLLFFFVTVAYVIITLNLATQSKKAVMQSEKAIEQSRSAQEVMYIQRRLEKLYFPLKYILNEHQIVGKNFKSPDFISKFKSAINQIIPYLYLSSDKLCLHLNEFMNILYYDSDLTMERFSDQIEKDLAKYDKTRETDEESEKKYRELQFNKLFWDATSSNPIWKDYLRQDLEVIPVLHKEIVKIIEKDISDYQNKLNILTTRQRSED